MLLYRYPLQYSFPPITMSISLSRQAALTLTQQLAERLAERIHMRLLPAGARLPSVRECARQQGVSSYTVVAAYDLLQAQGLVEARPQRGFFVRDYAQNPLQTQEGKRKQLSMAERLTLRSASHRVHVSTPPC